MKTTKELLVLMGFILLSLGGNKGRACSMYKITADGKTMVGCNHDTWFSTPRIWFENAGKPNEYGACFTGARPVGPDRTAPQSGMNEKGLAFSRLAAYHPHRENPFPGRRKIEDEVDYLSAILHQCATVSEVKAFIQQYDHSLFFDHVFMYIEPSGRYLIVEPYTLLEGNDVNYVLSNFCPSITDQQQANRLDRYRNGEDFLATLPANASLAYCTALADTMSVSRSRNGDGTLLTSIWDTHDGVVNLYFYHAFNATVKLNLAEELAKGDHVLDVDALFPPNEAFERLKTYKTPYNTPALRLSLVAIGGLLALIIAFLTPAVILARHTQFTLRNFVPVAALQVVLICYLIVLVTHESVYYFDAPYHHYQNLLITASSYTPFLLLAVIIPYSMFTVKRLQSSATTPWLKVLLTANLLLYFLLLLGFGYWGLLSVWN